MDLTKTLTPNKAREEQAITAIKYALYARKSTESEERQVLSIDSQVKEMLQLAEKENLNIVEIKRESHSAKNVGQRPIFNELIGDIRAGKFNGILCWAPDRIARNAGDLGAVVDLIDQKLLLEVRTYGQKFSNSPSEKLLLMILGSQAKLENDQKGINVKRGLRARVEMGLWPTTAPTGYLNEKRTDRKGYVMIDPERGQIIKKMFEKVANEKWSGRKLYHWLRFEINFKTKGNKNLSLSNIYLILQNHFYYGMFEYPRGGGSWYAGKHEPIIGKELFERVQDQIKRDQLQRENREFAFTKLLTCGLCGSGISACEKFKKLKDGTTNKYIYYGCARSKDKNCDFGYTREEELIKQLMSIIDEVDMNEVGIRHRFEKEIERFNRFQQSILRIKDEKKVKAKEIDLREYAKYILQEGGMLEKRELLGCLKGKIVLQNKTVRLLK